MLFRSSAASEAPCSTRTHQNPVSARWEMRVYQNWDRMMELMRQGVNEHTIAQAVWDEACRGQDRVGIRVHKTLLQCDACAQEAITRHAGAQAATEAMLTAHTTGGALLLVSDRLTEQSGVVSALPGTIQEEELLPVLRGMTRSQARRSGPRKEPRPRRRR